MDYKDEITVNGVALSKVTKKQEVQEELNRTGRRVAQPGRQIKFGSEEKEKTEK